MLSDVIASVNPLLVAAMPTLEVQVGGEFVKESSAPPRIVWVPTSDTFEGAEQHGAAEPRAILTRVSGAEVHIWGADVASTETLINTFIATLHGTANLWGGYGVESGRWATGAEGSDLGNLGYEYTLSLVFRIPVTMPANGVVKVLTTPITKQITFGDGTTEGF